VIVGSGCSLHGGSREDFGGVQFSTERIVSSGLVAKG
jgi:hypothetical protein